MPYTARQRKRKSEDASDSYMQQVDIILTSARNCFETYGLKKTTMAMVAHEAQVTRELIYYYFDSKNDLMQGVVDSYVIDAAESATLWCETWQREPAPERSYDAITDAVATLRRFVYTKDNQHRPMFDILLESEAYHTVILKMCDEVVRTVRASAAVMHFKTYFDFYTEDQIDDAFRMIVIGLTSLMDIKRSLDDMAIVKLLLAHAL